MLKGTLALCAMLVASAMPATVTAGTVTNATITSVAPTQYGGVNGATPFFIYLSIADSDIGCNSGNLTAFAVDSGTAGGRAMIAVAIAAQVSGRTITVVGQGSCNVWSVVESANVIYLN
jgi:hypothetical protein